MFRDRTNLYLSYRRTIPRDLPSTTPTSTTTSTRFQDFPNEEENEGLMLSSRKQQNNNNMNIPLKPMVPSIFEISSELEVLLSVIRKNIDDLNGLYKKLIIGTSRNKQTLEAEIEELNYQILKNFEGCYVYIKKFDYLSKNYHRLELNYTVQDLEILNNFKKNYAVKIQENSLVFRNLQNNYMKFLKNDDDDDEEENLLIHDDDTDDVFDKSGSVGNESGQVQTQSQIHKHENSQFLEQREREISKLAHGILEISTIFKEMESMVVEQGTMLDRIDYNLTNTVQELKSADKELIKAHTYQKRTTKCKIIFFLSLCVFALLMIFMLRPSHTTTIIEKPSNDKPAVDKPTVDNPTNDQIERPNIDKPVNEINHPDDQLI
ncbi:TLG2 t-SNARE affecting a late Golgi compartment protein 2 [Candida maltosa Xu316]|uniref:t-SNARE coiled-coil homology domain-containing protein n=1 Tax=Candida maltosa (strain Xu316) TaxID=1245528 RepID=M3K6R8_CANMX|nr:hypothetical protein G210_5706 [Candida maltosa Xu316]